MTAKYKSGDRIGKYRVVRELGYGGMGTVVEVRLTRGGDTVALKYCTEMDEDSRRRFAREVRAMKTVDHRNVIKVLDDDLDHDPPYFVMPKAKGSLQDELHVLSQDHLAALAAFLEMCAGVSAVHEHVGPHRDLKPGNALRFGDGRVVISDFGLAKFDPRDTTVLTHTSTVLGTTLYMAPEQRRRGGSKHAEALVDVYALGATLYALLTNDDPPPTDLDGISPPLAHIVRKATAAYPVERYQGVKELAEAVQDYVRILQRGKSPLRVFIDARNAVAQRHATEGEWNDREVRDLLAATRGLLAQPDVLMDEFDLIPDDTLGEMARNWPEPLADALDAYRQALDKIVGGRAFAYAESVAERMQRVFKRTKSATLKAVAVRAALLAASDLNRFAALNTLEEMIRSVKREETATAVAVVLREEARRFRRHAEPYRRGELHPLLRDVVGEIDS